MLNTIYTGKVLGTKYTAEIEMINSLPSWCLPLTNRYCLYARYHASALGVYKEQVLSLEFTI